MGSPLTKNTNRLIGRAMHTYNMLTDGDKVMLAVSGGIDSLVLTWVLDHWRQKAPINYELLAVHLDMGFGDKEPQLVKNQLERLNVPFLVEETSFGKEALEAEYGKSGCYHCARQRRNRLFELAKEKGFTKLAFGHHQEDIIETFFLNIFYSGNISTMVPRQDLFEGKLSIIRPFAFLGKKAIKKMGTEIGISPVPNPCPLSSDSKRETVRKFLDPLYQKDSTIKASIFAALSNVKADYLLTPSIEMEDPNEDNG